MWTPAHLKERAREGPAAQILYSILLLSLLKYDLTETQRGTEEEIQLAGEWCSVLSVLTN